MVFLLDEVWGICIKKLNVGTFSESIYLKMLLHRIIVIELNKDYLG